MDVKLKLSDLRAAGRKHPEFWREATILGTIEGDELRISVADFDRLNEQYFPGGLGNLVHWMAAPVAKVLGIEDCGGCAARRLRWNG